MRHHRFNNIKPRRLRQLMWLFFIALATPTSFLVYKSYDQLKWEAFYQNRVLAEELSNQIDQKLKAFILNEQRRGFNDYTFATNDINNNDVNNNIVIQRSPLSALPVENTSLGVIGYFQIGLNDQFSTPFLPNSFNNNQQYTFSVDEQKQRQIIQDQIKNILSSNSLVAIPESSDATDGQLTLSNSLKVDPTLQNQAAFDRLSNAKQPSSNKEKDDKGALFSRLQELEKLSPYKEKVDQRKNYEKTKKRPIEQKFSEKDALVAKKQQQSKLEKRQAKPTRDEADSLIPELSTVETDNISLFANDIDAFEMSLLESGHFMLYRKVWRNNQRYIQGMLLQQDTVFKSFVKDSFVNSLLFNMSNLTVIYQGNALVSFDQKNQHYDSYRSSRSALDGTLLLRARLSAPFDELEPIFTVRRLPIGAGSKVILWSALVMILTLIAGIYSLYRLSLRNLSLVNQQQDFVSAVSHELKTPLTSIRMYGEILQQGWADEEKKKSYYRYIFDESERLTRLINNVLELARMTRNETPVNLRSIDVNELIDIIKSKVDSQIERSNFEFNIQIDEGTKQCKLSLDQDIFSQIIINLVDNALKFSANAECKQIDFKVQRQSNGKLCFSLRDYGPGISNDQMKKIFTLFYRTEDELTRSTTGTGIGLALVSQLTHLMHGKIDVINHAPGAEFQLLFDSNKS